MYDGFISYSHAADDLLAPRLQSALQRFAKPWWKRRAVRIFRDESSLSANPHLWSSITEALDTSSWFLLLLSPDAAESEWVNQEISYWVEHRDPKKILPVVTDGTFGWADEVMTGTAVPDALQGVFAEEPRWVDLRFAKGEEQLDLNNPTFSAAVADIASAIRGVPKDELESEEVRQHRRTVRTAWAAGIVTAALAVAAIGFGIQSARNADEAERQAAIAEQNAVEADTQRQAAEQNAREADENASLAEANAEESNQQRDLAEASASLAEARELAASAIAVVDADPGLASWLALLAIKQTPEGEDHPVEVVNALWKAVSGNPLALSADVGTPGNTFIDLSADGRHLAVSSTEDAALELRLAGDFSLVWRYAEDTEDGFSKPSFSPDGQHIALPVVGSRAQAPWRDGGEDDMPNRVMILDANAGTVIHVLEFPECESVDAATWSPEGDLLAVATGPGGCELPQAASSIWMQLFDTSSWESTGIIDWESEDLAVLPLFVAADRLAAFPSHSSPRVYDTQTLELVEILDGIGATMPPAVSRESGLAALFSNDILIARVHELASGAQIDVLGELEAWPEPPFGLSFSRDGNLLAGATAGRILIWDMASGEQILRLTPTAGAMNSVFSPDGRTLYSGHLDGTVKAWTLNPGGLVLHEVEKLTTATFINGNKFTVGSTIGAMERIEFEPFGRFAQFFSVEDGTFLGDPVPSGGGPAYPLPDDRFVMLSPDVIFSDDTEWHWQVYDPVTGESMELGASCPNDCFAVVSTSGAEIGIGYEQDDGSWIGELHDAQSLEVSGSFVVDGVVDAMGDDWVLQRIGEQAGAFFFTDRDSGEELFRVSMPPIHSQVSNDGLTVALSGRQGPIHLVDTATWEATVLDLGIGRRRGLSFSPDDSLLAVGDEDELLIIDIGQQKIVQEVPVPLVSDVFWFSRSEILIGDRNGVWARLSLDFDDLVARATESLAWRALAPQECTTYRIDPCPTLEEMRER